MILLFTDYGSLDPYAGLMKAVILDNAPKAEIIDILHNAPAFNVNASAHLLASMASRFPLGSVCVGVVDPGVGSNRSSVVMLADERWYVGPDNGLLSLVAKRSVKCELWRIKWRPEICSVSFEGRDVFAPIAAWIDQGTFPHSKLSELARLDIYLDDKELLAVIYIDHFGNVITGLPAKGLSKSTRFIYGTRSIEYGRVFSNVVPNSLFWYENSLGMVEFSMNGSSAAHLLDARIGDHFETSSPL